MLRLGGRRGRGPRTRPRRRIAGARPRRCSARACARSTTAPGRVWPWAAQPIAGVVAALPSRGGCDGTPRPGAPSSRSRTRRGRRRRGGRRRARTSSAWSSSSGRGASPGGDRLAERRARLDRQRVRAHVLGPERERGVERRVPVGDRLARRAVDEVEVQPRRCPPRRGRRPPAPRSSGRACGRARRARAVRIDCTPNDTRFTPRVAVARGACSSVDRVGVALDGDLGVGRAGWRRGCAMSWSASSSDGVPPPKNTLVGRASARAARGRGRTRRRTSSIRCARSVQVAKSQ